MIIIKILVLDYASDKGGANRISEYINDEMLNDTKNHWLLITSVFQPIENSRVNNISVPWIKKSLLSRLWFEKVILPQIIKNFGPDVVFSLQNLKTKAFKGPQVVYLHQSLPFVNYPLKSKFNGIAKLKIKLLSRLIKKDVKTTDLILVQTQFMLDQVKKYNKNVVQVMPKLFNDHSDTTHTANDFIYPTSAQNYKRFDLVEQIAEMIKKKQLKMRILLTLEGNETENLVRLKQKTSAEKLPIEFIGYQDQKQLKELYKTHNLLFTSEIESLGLPLIEAMHFGCKILAYDIPVTREVLGDYPYKVLFQSEDIENSLQVFYKGLTTPSKGHDIESTSLLKVLRENHLID